MQIEKIERVEDLSAESRKQLREQVARVQREAKRLRVQTRRLRRAKRAEVKERQKLLAQVAESSRLWGRDALQRSGDLATAGVTMAGNQLKLGQQKAREYSGSLAQGIGQLGNQATQNLSDASDRLVQQSRGLVENTADWGDDTAYRLRKGGRRLANTTSDWSHDTRYNLRKGGRSLLQQVGDWGDEILYRSRRSGRNLGRALDDRREDLAYQMHAQKRDLGRAFTERREDTAHQLQHQGRVLGRSIAGRRDDALRQVRKQRDYLSERGGRMLEPVRGSRFWSLFGFVAGVLVAGGATFWLVRRLFRPMEVERRMDEALELEVRARRSPQTEEDKLSPVGRTRRTALVTRFATSASPRTRYVGVLSSHRYYPLERHPEVPDRVYFDTEEEARAGGFILAEYSPQ